MILVDTGPLVALSNIKDIDHERCLRWYEHSHGRLLIPAPILAEVAYLLQEKAGPLVEAKFFRELAHDDQFELANLERADLLRIAELIEQYRNFPLGGSDAAVIAVSERLQITQIATLDQRHFTAVRPRHTHSFDLVIV